MDENEISLDTNDLTLHCIVATNRIYLTLHCIVATNRIYLTLHCIVATNRIYDQPDDGLEKRPKHVVVPKIHYVNKSP
jgi:hypothetical protein